MHWTFLVTLSSALVTLLSVQTIPFGNNFRNKAISVITGESLDGFALFYSGILPHWQNLSQFQA